MTPSTCTESPHRRKEESLDAIRTVEIGRIKIGERLRKDMGDLEALAESIRELGGVIQPVVVTQDLELVHGERTLRACQDILGWATIPVRVCPVASVLLGEVAPNLLQKAYTVSERVAIADALRTHRHGGDRRSKQVRSREVEPLSLDSAAKQACLGGKDGYYRARAVLDRGVPELVAAMDREEVPLSAAAQVAGLTPEQQRSVLAKNTGHARWMGREVRKVKKIADVEKRQRQECEVIAGSAGRQEWEVMADQAVVTCDLLITDPPQGILRSVDWDSPPEGIEAFTRDWCRRWSSCGANHVVVFWAQRTKWEARRWLDESLDGYEFLQECCCHRQNHKKPEGGDGTHRRFRSSWEPVFVYRREGASPRITQSNHPLGDDLTDLDHHSASYPTRARNDADYQQHPAQKPVSALRWLIHALTQPGDLVVDPFCGSGTAGIASLQLGRRFHGIEVSEGYRSMAEARILMYGTASLRPASQPAEGPEPGGPAVVKGPPRIFRLQQAAADKAETAAMTTPASRS